MKTGRKEKKQLETRIADCILDSTSGRIAQWTREARLTTRTLAEAEEEDINKAEEDSKEEDSTTKAEDLITPEEDTKEEVSNKVGGLEEAEATSTQMISTSNIQMLLVTTALLQAANQDSNPIGATTTTKTLVSSSLISSTQTKDGTDN